MYFNLLLQVRVMRHKVEEARSNLEATKHRGDVLDGLMTMKKNGKIPGILGRLVSMFILLLSILSMTEDINIFQFTCSNYWHKK